MKKILLFLLAILVMGSCVTYAYQIPYKKYVAEKELYRLLENEHGLKPDEIHIIQVIKDIKSVRGGVDIRFTIRNSPVTYSYDYSVTKKDWIRGYVERGYYHSTDQIFLKEE
jgi:hypothetical protein